MIIEGTFALQISSETVPDFATAKVEDLRISDFIFSSNIEPQFLKPSWTNFSWIDLFCSEVEWKTKNISLYFVFINLTKSDKIGINTLISDKVVDSIASRKQDVATSMFTSKIEEPSVEASIEEPKVEEPPAEPTETQTWL